jgi:Na+/melibiose symporter-like transporter
MTKSLFAVFLTLVSLVTHAADTTESPAAVEVSAWPLIIVTLILVGMVAGFFCFVWVKERERKRRESEPS